MVTRLKNCLFLLLAAVLTLPPGRADAEYRKLRPLAVISCDSYDDLLTRAALGLQAIDAPDALTLLQRQAGALLLTPGMAGVDVNRPAHLFLLTYDPPDALPTPAALVPLSVAGGAAYLRTMQGLYEERSDTGSVSLFMGAKDASYPDPLYVAIAEGYAITARR
ncbi:MAG: hypothetical protein PHR35_14615, partial [Kiritimatiellae bacterium]|nr:hypothetical protein [Kiritimatiellia bacterium]